MSICFFCLYLLTLSTQRIRSPPSMADLDHSRSLHLSNDHSNAVARIWQLLGVGRLPPNAFYTKESKEGNTESSYFVSAKTCAAQA